IYFSDEELYENPWEDLISEKNPATYLTEIMTAGVVESSTNFAINPNLTKKNINMMDIEEKDLTLEQEARTTTTTLGSEAMQIDSTSSWRTYHSHHLKHRIIHFEATCLESYIIEQPQLREKKNMYLTSEAQMPNVGVKTFCIILKVGVDNAIQIAEFGMH
ncbi:12068_t:CDS:2, partial [Gigaspora margarita]